MSESQNIEYNNLKKMLVCIAMIIRNIQRLVGLIYTQLIFAEQEELRIEYVMLHAIFSVKYLQYIPKTYTFVE